jgi:hypothetical protein
MTEDPDDNFFDRADAHINLANNQIGPEAGIGKVSASMLYSAARFNAWVGACGCDDSKEMEVVKEEMLEYFCSQFRKMLEDNIQDYIENYDSYISFSEDDA